MTGRARVNHEATAEWLVFDKACPECDGAVCIEGDVTRYYWPEVEAAKDEPACSLCGGLLEVAT